MKLEEAPCPSVEPRDKLMQAFSRLASRASSSPGVLHLRCNHQRYALMTPGEHISSNPSHLISTISRDEKRWIEEMLNQECYRLSDDSDTTPSFGVLLRRKRLLCHSWWSYKEKNQRFFFRSSSRMNGSSL